jgi:hypothetical protein
MADNIITIVDSHPCFNCGADLSLTENQCAACGDYPPLRWDAAGMMTLFQHGLVLDVSAGGLVLGRDDRIDDIPMIVCAVEGIYYLGAHMQGGEFIVRTNSSIKYKERLDEINSYEGPEYIVNQTIHLNNDSTIYNTNVDDNFIEKLDVRTKKVLVHAGQYIIRRSATAKYYEELVEINRSEPVYKLAVADDDSEPNLNEARLLSDESLNE